MPSFAGLETDEGDVSSSLAQSNFVPPTTTSLGLTAAVYEQRPVAGLLSRARFTCAARTGSPLPAVLIRCRRPVKVYWQTTDTSWNCSCPKATNHVISVSTTEKQSSLVCLQLTTITSRNQRPASFAQ